MRCSTECDVRLCSAFSEETNLIGWQGSSTILWLNWPFWDASSSSDSLTAPPKRSLCSTRQQSEFDQLAKVFVDLPRWFFSIGLLISTSWSSSITSHLISTASLSALDSHEHVRVCFSQKEEAYRKSRRTSFSISSWSWVFCRATLRNRRLRTFFNGGVTKWMDRVWRETSDVWCLRPCNHWYFFSLSISLFFLSLPPSNIDSALMDDRFIDSPSSSSSLELRSPGNRHTRIYERSFYRLIEEKVLLEQHRRSCTSFSGRRFCTIRWHTGDRRVWLWRSSRRTSLGRDASRGSDRWTVVHGFSHRPTGSDLWDVWQSHPEVRHRSAIERSLVGILLLAFEGRIVVRVRTGPRSSPSSSWCSSTSEKRLFVHCFSWTIFWKD